MGTYRPGPHPQAQSSLQGVKATRGTQQGGRPTSPPGKEPQRRTYPNARQLRRAHSGRERAAGIAGPLTGRGLGLASGTPRGPRGSRLYVDPQATGRGEASTPQTLGQLAGTPAPFRSLGVGP